MPHPPDPEGFAARLAPQHVVLAEEAGRFLGFMTLESGGYLDLAYILPGARGRGLFRALCDAIETEARARGALRLATHASLMAEPAFRAMGFAVMHRETVDLGGQSLARARMEKELT
jgi:putative acetyltransferase